MMISSLIKLSDIINRLLLPNAHVTNMGSFSTVPDLAAKVNDAFFLILVISIVLLVLVTAFMVYFAIRYRASKNPTPEEVKESLLLEITWTVIPTILVAIMFYVGWENFVAIRDVPEDSIPVKVTARMWSWHFEYENGLKSNILRVPAGRPVSLSITSEDVIHSLFIPVFKIKEDAVPGMETSMWLISDKTGEYDIFCAEYCGQGHSSMNSKVLVMSEDEFKNWYESAEKLKIVPSQAIELLDDNSCLDCHSTDGSRIIGPSFKDIFGRKTVVITDGKEREIITDEHYLINSIMIPNADVVKGYPGIMPSFEGEISEEDINSIIQYLKTIK
jgi:cytochrome c oxidase subunit 2